jgi:hypothetical protein
VSIKLVTPGYTAWGKKRDKRLITERLFIGKEHVGLAELRWRAGGGVGGQTPMKQGNDDAQHVGDIGLDAI